MPTRKRKTTGSRKSSTVLSWPMSEKQLCENQAKAKLIDILHQFDLVAYKDEPQALQSLRQYYRKQGGIVYFPTLDYLMKQPLPFLLADILKFFEWKILAYEHMSYKLDHHKQRIAQLKAAQIAIIEDYQIGEEEEYEEVASCSQEPRGEPSGRLEEAGVVIAFHSTANVDN